VVNLSAGAHMWGAPTMRIWWPQVGDLQIIHM